MSNDETVFDIEFSEDSFVDVPIYHHLFSSLNGYKTIFASEGLLPQHLKDFEEIAIAAYSSNGEKNFYACFRDQDGNWIQTKLLEAGTDHVGRIRYCIHTIVIYRDDLENPNFFAPIFNR